MTLDAILFSDWFRWPLFALVIGAAWYGWTRRLRRMANTLRLMARRLEGGRVHFAHWSLAYPTLSFRHRSYPVAVSAAEGSKQHSPRTYFNVTVPRRLPFDMKVRREHLAERVEKAVGARDILVGDEAFDKAFFVRGDDASKVRTILTPELRAALMWFQNLEPWVTVKGRELEVGISTIPGDRGLYERFFALGKLLTDAVADAVG